MSAPPSDREPIPSARVEATRPAGESTHLSGEVPHEEVGLRALLLHLHHLHRAPRTPPPRKVRGAGGAPPDLALHVQLPHVDLEVLRQPAGREPPRTARAERTLKSSSPSGGWQAPCTLRVRNDSDKTSTEPAKPALFAPSITRGDAPQRCKAILAKLFRAKLFQARGGVGALHGASTRCRRSKPPKGGAQCVVLRLAIMRRSRVDGVLERPRTPWP